MSVSLTVGVYVEDLMSATCGSDGRSPFGRGSSMAADIKVTDVNIVSTNDVC